MLKNIFLDLSFIQLNSIYWKIVKINAIVSKKSDINLACVKRLNSKTTPPIASLKYNHFNKVMTNTVVPLITFIIIRQQFSVIYNMLINLL